MNYFKIALIILLLSSFNGGSFAQNAISTETITDQQHPRILLLKGEESQIRKSIAGSPYWKNMHEAILTESNNILNLSPVERIQIGRRLLDKSREALRRIFHLSYAWRMTGDQKYFDRCEKEMLAISKFNDWNPSHFLDVGEMTMAMAIGYDWLFPNLSAESKKIIRDAIVYKGIYPSLDPKYNSWLRVTNNWNQVCNAGMTFGALAVAEDHPGLSKNIIDRAIASIPLAMDEYKPDGAYPEGYGYWGYGTSFNVMFLSAIETVFKSDFELNAAQGFLQTAGFLQNMTGATGPCFNWGDCGLGGSLNPAMFWLAQKNNDPSLLWVEKGYLQSDDYSGFTRDRLLPSIMIWGKDLPLDKIPEPNSKVWKGQGANPLAMMRTSWTSPEAVYLGFKAGSPSVNHGHMDVGSFVMEADGKRWASDPGMQSYESLESKGMSIFGRTQDAQRWTIFRLNNHAHNVLTFDGQLQQVSGYAKIDKTSGKEGFKFAISDISTVYNNQVKKAVRGVAIQDEKYVVVRDEIETTGKTTKVKWAMFTFATTELGNNSATLTIGSKKLYIKVNAPVGTTMKTWSTAPTNDYDATNPGTIMVGFECEIPANSKAVIEVLLVPEKAKEMAQFLNKKLDDWN